MKHKHEIIELVCQRCDRDYPIWFTQNDTWNKVIRDEVAGDDFEYLCPTCFVVRASMKGVNSMWEISEEPVNNSKNN